MVDAVDVVELGDDFHPLFPPEKAVFAHRFKIEEGRSPILAEGIVGIWRGAGVQVEAEEGGVAPDVDAVRVDEDGDVSFEEDALFLCVAADEGHLAEGVELEEGVEVDVFGTGCGVGGPVAPMFVAVLFFEGFEAGVEGEPGVFGEEALVGGGLREGGKGLFEEFAEEGEFKGEDFNALFDGEGRERGDAELGEAEVDGIERR